jgi:ribosome-associated protein
MVRDSLSVDEKWVRWFKMQIGPYFLPSSEFDWTFAPSGGPGGQHANRSHTRVTLRFDLGHTTVIPEEVRNHMLTRLANRAGGGIVSVTVDETRSQATNREIALERMSQLLNEAMRRPRRRRATRPSAASREKRLEEKRRRSEKKRERRRDWE